MITLSTLRKLKTVKKSDELEEEKTKEVLKSMKDKIAAQEKYYFSENKKDIINKFKMTIIFLANKLIKLNLNFNDIFSKNVFSKYPLER